MSEDRIRTFIAIDCSEEVRGAAARMQERLRLTGAHVKWIKPDQLHVTMMFLGNTPVESVQRISDTIDAATAQTTAFEYKAERLGLFGRPHRPKAVWAGISAPSQLSALRACISEGLDCLHIDFDHRPFKPHLTIGRVRSTENAEDLISEVRAQSDTAFGTVPVSSVLLIKSVLAPTGPEYSVLHESGLITG